MSDTNQKQEDEVLRRMLATPPTPHNPKKTGLTPMKKTKAKPVKEQQGERAKPRRV